MPLLIPALPGCYVVVEQGQALYVGIAKNMRRRLRDHLSDDPSRANLTLRMAAHALDLGVSAVKQHEDFSTAFTDARQRLLNCAVAWVRINNPLEMYIFEPYCAMQLDTRIYNRFDTLQILSPKRPS